MSDVAFPTAVVRFSLVPGALIGAVVVKDSATDKHLSVVAFNIEPHHPHRWTIEGETYDVFPTAIFENAFNGVMEPLVTSYVVSALQAHGEEFLENWDKASAIHGHHSQMATSRSLQAWLKAQPLTPLGL